VNNVEKVYRIKVEILRGKLDCARVEPSILKFIHNVLSSSHTYIFDRMIFKW